MPALRGGVAGRETRVEDVARGYPVGRMRTLKITLAYDGTHYVGWQRQARGESIQQRLEDALARFEGARVVAHASGRTDAGVHALAQVASAQVTFAHDTDAIVRGLNAQLPADIRVLRVEDAAPTFHARFSARSKTYEYRIRHACVANPFARAYEWHLTGSLDVEAMQEAAGSLVGTHDFAAFRTIGTEIRETIRTITTSTVIDIRDGDHRVCVGPDPARVPVDASGRLVVYRVCGDGFLRHMVRAIVGTLVDVGRGRRRPENMADLLRGAERGDAGATAPPHGLFLVRVDYD